MLTFFTLQPDYVNIANLPMPGAIAIILALLACGALGLLHRIWRDSHRHSVLYHDACDDGDRRRVSAVLVRGHIAYSVPPLILTLGSKSIVGVP